MTTTTQTVGQPLSVGAKAPDFTLPMFDGNKFTLSQAVQNGPVVVAFFPGTFTNPCTTEMCTLSDELEQFKGLGAQVVGVSADSTHSQKEFAAKNNLKVPLASDFNKETVKAYGVPWASPWGLTAKRSVFLVDKQGIVRFAWVTEDAKVQPDVAALKSEIQKVK